MCCVKCCLPDVWFLRLFVELSEFSHCRRERKGFPYQNSTVIMLAFFPLKSHKSFVELENVSTRGDDIDKIQTIGRQTQPARATNERARFISLKDDLRWLFIYHVSSTMMPHRAEFSHFPLDSSALAEWRDVLSCEFWSVFIDFSCIVQCYIL